MKDSEWSMIFLYSVSSESHPLYLKNHIINIIKICAVSMDYVGEVGITTIVVGSSTWLALIFVWTVTLILTRFVH